MNKWKDLCAYVSDIKIYLSFKSIKIQSKHSVADCKCLIGFVFSFFNQSNKWANVYLIYIYWLFAWCCFCLFVQQPISHCLYPCVNECNWGSLSLTVHHYLCCRSEMMKKQTSLTSCNFTVSVCTAILIWIGLLFRLRTFLYYIYAYK